MRGPMPWFAAIFALVSGCSGDTPSSASSDPPVAPAAAAPALPRVPADVSHRFAASHVLVSYAGAVNALPNVTRTPQEARTRADEARARIQAGTAFSEIARAYSDDATGPRGGGLGGFEEGTMVKPFEDAVRSLAVGQVSELVETPFGYHVIQRESLAELHAAHLFVSWKGAERAPAAVTRSKDAARTRMDEALATLAGGKPWAEVVRAYSDGPLNEDGGDLGWLGRGQLAPALDAAAFDLDVAATSAVIESPRGYHVIRRIE